MYPELERLAKMIARLKAEGVKLRCTPEQRANVLQVTGKDMVEEWGFEVVEETTPEDTMIVCMRVKDRQTDLPLLEGTKVERCATCQEDIYVARTTPTGRRECSRCAGMSVELEFGKTMGVH